MSARGRGAGLAGPATAESKSKGIERNSAPTWRAVQREHAARASALVARGIHYRREIRVRTRL